MHTVALPLHVPGLLTRGCCGVPTDRSNTCDLLRVDRKCTERLLAGETASAVCHVGGYDASSQLPVADQGLSVSRSSTSPRILVSQSNEPWHIKVARYCDVVTSSRHARFSSAVMLN